MHRIFARLALAGVACAAGLWALSSLWWPYGWDHGAFAYVSDVIHRGGVPYRDVWDAKGPLVYYVCAILQLGRQMWGLRVFDLAILSAGCWAGAKIVGAYVGRVAAAITVLTLVLAFASFGNWYTAQPDGWVAYVLVVVVALLLRPSRGVRSVAAAALLVSLAALTKPLYAAYFLLLVLAVVPVRKEDRAASLRTLAIAAGAFALPIAIAAIWFKAHGALDALVDVHLRFNAERLRTDPDKRMPLATIAQLAISVLTSTPDLAIGVPAAALGGAIVLRERTRDGIVLVAWLALGLLSIAAQGKFLFHNYSWHVVYPPVAILAGIGLGRLWREAATQPSLAPLRALVFATGLLLFYHASKGPLAQTAKWVRYVAGKTSLEDFRASFEGPLPWLGGERPADAIGFSVTRDLRLGEYLRARTSGGDRVLVWCDPLVNHFAGRAAITPIVAPEAFTIWATPERRSRYKDELLAALREPTARYVGVPKMALAKEGSPEFILATGFPELAAALDAEYAQVDTFDDVAIYERKR